MITKMDKLRAMIYGLAVGDALGVPYEFNDRKDMNHNPCKDMVGYGTYNQPIGSWSDDTSMTLCLLNAINYETKTVDMDEVAKNFLNWMDNAKFTANDIRFDIGNTTKNALNNMRGKKGRQLVKCGIKGNHDGNGALMRISPLIPLLDGCSFRKKQEMISDIVTMTHGNELNVIACQFYCLYMEQLWENKTKRISLDNILALFDTIYGDVVEWNIIHNAITRSTLEVRTKGLAKVPATGYVVDTLSASIYCLVKAENHKDAVLMAVNLGDDTDTTAAVTGSMAGLYFGYDDIPKEWIDKLLNKELINHLIVNSKI